MNEPVFNLIVIRSRNLEKSIEFYRLLGLNFSKHCHKNGIEHFASQIGKVTFEIYPQKIAANSTAKTRLGFEVADLNPLVSELQHRGYAIITPPQQSEWGLRAVVADPDGHRVELVQAIANSKNIRSSN